MKKDDMSLPIRHDIPFKIGDRVQISDTASFDGNLPTLGRGHTGTIRGSYRPNGEDLRVRGNEGQDWIVAYTHLVRIEGSTIAWENLRPDSWTMADLFIGYDTGALTASELLHMPVAPLEPEQIRGLLNRGLITRADVRDYFDPPQV